MLTIFIQTPADGAARAVLAPFAILHATPTDPAPGRARAPARRAGREPIAIKPYVRQAAGTALAPISPVHAIVLRDGSAHYAMHRVYQWRSANTRILLEFKHTRMPPLPLTCSR